MTDRRRSLVLICVLVIVASVVPMASASHGGKGHITALSANDAPNPGDSITIAASGLSEAKINNSNVYYEIYAPDGKTVVATHTTNLSSLGKGDTWNDNWSTDNSAFPSQGTYTLVACWSSGNSTSCQIDASKTAFYSVPTLGWVLSGVALVLIGAFLWRRRKHFERVPQPA